MVANYTNLLDAEASPPEGWSLRVDQVEDWFIWHPGFTAQHKLGTVVGDENGELHLQPKDDNQEKKLETAFNEAFPNWNDYSNFDTWEV